ncbi:MAG: hypothetical protein AB1306_08580 [Nitrospirota bacterium]
MDVGFGGALFVCISLILFIGWPYLLVLSFIIAKRKSMTKKWLFFVFGVVICYITQAIIVGIAYTFVDSWIPGFAVVSLLVVVLLSTIELLWLSKKYQLSINIRNAS